MMASPGSADGRVASTSHASLGNKSARESCEKPLSLPVNATGARENRILNAWGKRSATTRFTSSSKTANTSKAGALEAAGSSEKPETKVVLKPTPLAEASKNEVSSATATGSITSPTHCKSATSKNNFSGVSPHQKVDAKDARGSSTGDLTVGQFETSATLLKNNDEVQDARHLATAPLAPGSPSPRSRKDAAAPETHLELHDETQPAAARESELKNLPSANSNTLLKDACGTGGQTINAASGDRSCSSSDIVSIQRSTEAVSADGFEASSTTEVSSFFDGQNVGMASMETLAAKLKTISFQEVASTNMGAALTNGSNANNYCLHTKAFVAANKNGEDDDLGDGNGSMLLNCNIEKSGYMFPGDAMRRAQPYGPVNSARQLNETLFPTHRNMVLSTVLKEPACTAAALAAGDITAAELALAFPSEHARQHRTSRDCPFDGATGASVIAAAAVLAQQESRPLLLTRFEMLEAYAKGRLCLSCDSKSHRMPSCPYGEFVCPNCHRSSHRGEECPLRCRFCQTLHVGISVTVCIKRFRGPLEALLGIPLPLRDLQPASLLSSGSPLSPFGPAACTRPNSAFGRSVYLSNLPPNTTQEAVAAAVESLVTKGRLMQVDLHEKHAFVQLSTLEAAFELVDKRRQLQIRGVTLKVQFKKTGVFTNVLPQGAAAAVLGGGVLHPSGSTTGSGFSVSSAGCNSNNGGSHASASTPLSAASSPAGGTFNGEAATPKVSPSLNSLLTFLGPPAAPYVSDICAQVAAKLREDLQLGLVSAQQPPQQSLFSSGSAGVQQRVGDTMQLKQQLQAQTSYDEALPTPLPSSLLSMAVSNSNTSSVNTLLEKSGRSSADAMAEISAAAAAAANSGEEAAAALLSCGINQNRSRTLGTDHMQRPRHLPYMDNTAASAAALLQQQQLLALSREQQKTTHVVSTEKLLMQLLQQQHIEQQQQQLAQQHHFAQQRQHHRFGHPGAREDSSSSSPPSEEMLFTETLMRAAAAAAGRCMPDTAERSHNEGYNARRQVQLQLQQQEEQLQDLQQQQRRQQRLLQLGCSASDGSLLETASQKQQLHHQRSRQIPDLRELMGLSHFPMYSEAVGKPFSTDSLTALGLTSSQSDISLDPYVATAEGHSPGSRNKAGSNTANENSTSTARNSNNGGGGFDLQLLLCEKNRYNDLSTSAASLPPCFSRTDATPAHSNIKNSSAEGGLAFTSLQHPWNDLAAAATAAIPAATGCVSGLTNSSLSSSQTQQHQQKGNNRMRLQELHQHSLAHSSSTPLSTTTTFAENDSVYKRLSPHHLIDGPATVSTDSGSLLSSSTTARLVAAADEKYCCGGSNSTKHLDSSRVLAATKGVQQVQPTQLGFAAPYAAETPATAPTSSSPAAEDRFFHTKKLKFPSLAGTPNSSAEELTAAAADSSSTTPADSTRSTGGGVTSTHAKSHATQHLLDVAAVLMRKAMEDTPDVEELARQLYHATQDLPHETVQQLLLTLASNGWGGAVAAAATEEEDEEDGDDVNDPSKAEGDNNSSTRPSSSFLV